MEDQTPDQTEAHDPFVSAPEPAPVAEPAEKAPKEPRPRKPRPVSKTQVDAKSARTVLALARDLDKLSTRDRDLMAGLYRTEPVVDELVVAVLSGVEPATQHIHDVISAAENDDLIEVMVDTQVYADADPDRFRNAWAALAEVSPSLPKTARPGVKTVAQFVKAAKALDKATIARLRAPLALVR